LGTSRSNAAFFLPVRHGVTDRCRVCSEDRRLASDVRRANPAFRDSLPFLPGIALEPPPSEPGCPVGELGDAGDFPDASRTELGWASPLVDHPRRFPGCLRRNPETPGAALEAPGSIGKRASHEHDRSSSGGKTPSSILELPKCKGAPR
jgi:hypothetical protein